MKIKLISLSVIIIVTLCIETASSQIVLPAKKTELSATDQAVLDKQISEYVVFTLDASKLLENFRANGYCLFQLHIDEQWSWTIYLDADKRWTGEGGVTCKGKTANNEPVIISIGKDFYGSVHSNKGDYLIRPIWLFTQNFTDKSLIAFKASDINSGDSGFDATDNATAVSQEDEPQSIMTVEEGSAIRSGGVVPLFPCPVTLELAIDVDYDFYLKFGSDMARIKEFVGNELGAIKNVHKQTFNLKFDTTYVHVWTSDTTPGYPYSPKEDTSSNADTLLFQFRRYWNDNMMHIPRNLTHLFSGKDSMYIVGAPNIGGIAHIGHISDSLSYSLVADWPGVTFQVTAHEIGHNLGGTHIDTAADSIDCVCETPSVAGGSVMCQSGIVKSSLWFCEKSINEISSFLKNNEDVLLGNGTNSLSLSGTLTGVKEYRRGLQIKSVQVISSGYTSYKSRTRIVLAPGFRVVEGARFTGNIDEDVGCDEDGTPLVASRFVPSHFAENNGAIEMRLSEPGPRLYQNFPNPFTGQTVIGYYLPETSGPAWIRVINTGGVTVKTVNIAASGEGEIVLDTGSLDPGVYIYSLLVNGEIIDTKRMLAE